MFRETMDDDHGMLFVFEQTRPVEFLDEEHADAARPGVHRCEDGAVRDILPGEPFSEAADRSGRSLSNLSSN